jgi:hypothetical protein
VAFTVALCGEALPSVRDTVKLPSSSPASCRKEIAFAARSACVKLVVAEPPFSTVPCAAPVTV